MITVAHIIDKPKSGIGSLVSEIIKADTSGRFEYIVVLLESDESSKKLFENQNTRVVSASFRASPLFAIRTMREAIKSAQVVHVHSFVPQLAAYLSNARGLAVIRTVHNPYPYFFARDIRSAAKRVIEGLLIRATRSALISVSEETRNALPWKLAAETPSIVVDNGINLTIPKTAEPARPDGFLFITAGRLEHQKGMDVLVDAMSIISSKCDSAQPIHLWILGDGSCRQALSQQVQNKSVRNVNFLGHKENPADYLRVADAFVLASRFEGFGLAPAEAMAIGLPAVLANFGGIANKLAHGKTAHLVPVENPVALAEAMMMMVNTPSYRQTIASAGQEFVTANFSIQSCTEKYLSAYSELLRDKRNG